MDVERLWEVIRETTREFRKGEEVTEQKKGRLRVVEIFAMPHESEIPEGLEQVDCHFITVGIDKAKAEEYRQELMGLLLDYPIPGHLEQGPSYIEVGGVVGDQGMALRLFALGKVLGFWDVIIPEKLGITGSEADQMAGMGFVMISGFKPISVSS